MARFSKRTKNYMYHNTATYCVFAPSVNEPESKKPKIVY